MQSFRSMILASLAVALIPAAAPAAGLERVVSKQDTDRIFGLSRAEWNAQAKQMVHPEGWSIRLSQFETGTSVMAFDPKTGTGLSIQPLFRDAQGPPEMLVVGSYYPVGTFREFSEQLKRDMEADTRTDLGPAYSVRIVFSKMASPAPGFEVVEVIITQAPLHAQPQTLHEKLEAKYFGTLDTWVNRGGPSNEIQNTVVETCGKLVMLTAVASEKVALATTQREEFHFRVDVCTKMTVNRVHPQPEFEKIEIVKMICDDSTVTLFKTLCRHSGLR